MPVHKPGDLIPFGGAAKGVFMDVSKRGVWAAAAGVFVDVSKRGDRFPRLTSLRERVCESEMKQLSARVKERSMEEIYAGECEDVRVRVCEKEHGDEPYAEF